MKPRRLPHLLYASALLVACSDPDAVEDSLGGTASAETMLAADAGAVPDVEDIYVFRSLSVPITDESFCDSAPFPSAIRGSFDLYSIKVGTIDALVTDAQKKLVGHIDNCLGFTENPALLNFYARGEIDGVGFTGSGECPVAEFNFPEPGLVFLRCFAKIVGLPPGYVGGLLTTSTTAAIPGGPPAPLGYLASSIAVLRLWKSP